MAASFPGAIKTFTDKVDDVDDVVAVDINGAYDEIEAIETELGTNPAGSFTDVSERLDSDTIPKGTSFPGSPSTGDRFFRTDLGFECFFDGTRWLTKELFEVCFDERTSSANENTEKKWVGDVYGLAFVRFENRSKVITLNDSNSYWNITARSESLDGSVTVITTVSTGDAPDTAGIAYDHGEDITTPIPGNYGAIFCRAEKAGSTGTPGNLTWSATVTYRKIIT